MSLVFETKYGKIEVRPISASDPAGYAYFHSDDYETMFDMKNNRSGRFFAAFDSLKGTTFTVCFDFPKTGEAVLNVVREIEIARATGAD